MVEKNLIQNNLVDIRSIKIDEHLSKEERILSFTSQIKNPYCFRVGDVVVRVKYSENGQSLEECFKNLITAI